MGIKISTVMPVYNSAEYLHKTIDSVLAQTLREIELICVDDGSTDSSVSIIQKYARRDKRVRLVRQKNQYAGIARNNGLQYARGEYVHFMDSDDWIEPNAYEKLYNRVKDSKDDICIFFHYDYDNDSHEIYSKPHYIHQIEKIGESFYTNFEKDPRYFVYNAVVPWNKIYRRDFLTEYKFQFSGLQCANDRSFYFATVLKAKKIQIYNDFLLYYRMNNAGSVAGAGRLKNFDCHFRSMEEILGYCKDLPPVEYNMVVDVCMKDMFSFFDKATGCTKLEIWQKMYENFAGLDLAYSENHEINHYFNWYESYVSIKERLYPKEKVIISLTSFPPRIPYISKCIESLLMQSLYVEKVLLWLADTQFPHGNEDLPEDLTSLIGSRFEIRYCEDIRSYKKLIPTLRTDSDAVIITVDDDIEYNFDMAKNLYLSYLSDPKSVHAHRVTKMFVWENDKIRNLPGGNRFYSGAHVLNKPVGVGGVLYPKNCFYKDILNTQLFMELAPTNDDQWFWCMANLNGFFVRSIKNKILKLRYIEGTQEEALTKINDQGENLFYVQLKNLMDYYPRWRNMLENAYPMNYSKAEYVGTLHEELDTWRQKLNKLKTEFQEAACDSLELRVEKEDYNFYRSLAPKEYRRVLKKWAMRVRGKEINLSHPATFSEKIQWFKLYRSTRLKAKLSDKYLVRKWVEKKIGSQYLIPLIGVYKRFEDIDFETLPKKFALKCNHGSGWNEIVFDKDNLNKDELKEKVDRWMTTNFAYKVGLELHYKYIKPRIVIEEFMENKGGSLWDYKFACFDGKVKFIWVDTDRYTSHRRTLFDREWNVLPFMLEYPVDEILPEKPKQLQDMIVLAEKLAKGFSHVRVDFYLLNDGSIKFGEMTFTSGSGMDRFVPQYFDRVLGDLIKI